MMPVTEEEFLGGDVDPLDVLTKMVRESSEHDDPVDFVNNPPHYSSLDPRYPDLECIDFQRAMVGPDGFESHCKCQAGKYLWRAGRKRHDVDGTIEDLEKCRFYVNELIRMFSESEE